MHKLCSSRAFLRFILGQNEWDLPSVWGSWLSMGAQASNFQLHTQASTDPSCHLDAHSPQSLNTAQLSREQSWSQICCTESISIHQSAQPARFSHLTGPLLLFYSFETSLHIYPDTPQIHTQCKLSVVSIWLQTHTLSEAARKHPWLLTWSRAFLNNSVSFTSTPSKWLTGFLWREISLAGTTARLHSLYQKRGKLTQH